MIKRVILLLLSSILVLTGCNQSESSQLEEQIDNYQILKEDQEKKVEMIEDLEKVIVENKDQIDSIEKALVAMEKKVLELEKINNDLKNAADEAEESNTPASSVVSLAETVMALIEGEDFITLSTYVHPTQGVRFTPYSYVDISNDIVMTVADMAIFGTSTTMYTWGVYDGIGGPITGTPMDYYNDFIYVNDFIAPHIRSWNSSVGTGNMINNMDVSYPSADYVEFYFTGFDPIYEGMDWSSLTLVFEQSGGTWYLVGIIHGQWTI